MFIASALAASLTTVCLGVGDDRPPPLTFEQHVDYIAWYNDYVSKGKKGNAFDLYKGLYSDEEGRDGFPKPEGPAADQLQKAMFRSWTPKDFPELSAYLKKCRPYLATFKKAVKGASYWLPAAAGTEPLMKITISVPTDTRHAARAMLAQAMMKRDAQAEALNEACCSVLQNARHLQQTDLTIGVLVATAERQLVSNAVLAALDEGILKGDDITAMYSSIHRNAPGPRGEEARWLIIEWGACLDLVQYLCPKGEIDAAHLKSYFGSDEEHGQSELTAKLLSAKIDPRATTRLLDEYFRGMVNIADGGMTLAKSRQLDEFVKSHTPALEENILARAVMPSGPRAYLLQLRGETMSRGTLLTLAVHAHHAKHGQWPENLDKIDPTLGLKGLRELRVDPCSDSGADFIYKLKDGQPLLYSVADGKDDGGRHDPKWGEAGNGGDYVFWPYQR